MCAFVRASCVPSLTPLLATVIRWDADLAIPHVREYSACRAAARRAPPGSITQPRLKMQCATPARTAPRSSRGRKSYLKDAPVPQLADCEALEMGAACPTGCNPKTRQRVQRSAVDLRYSAPHCLAIRLGSSRCRARSVVSLLARGDHRKDQGNAQCIRGILKGRAHP